MADLAKYGEVKELKGWGYNNPDKVVNDLLRDGWQLITVKVVEAQFRIEARPGHDDSYIKKEAQTTYVLGKLNQNKGSAPAYFDRVSNS